MNKTWMKKIKTMLQVQFMHFELLVQEVKMASRQHSIPAVIPEWNPGSNLKYFLTSSA